MPLIRYTYPPEVARHGSDPVAVSDLTARVLLERRVAVLVDADDLEALPKPTLAELAEQVGAQVRKRDAKGHFVKAITEAQQP